ncbi:MAG: amidase family protein [Bacteroidetes bacterium]|nr:amidase family protein [Bacteroidota bacterium]
MVGPTSVEKYMKASSFENPLIVSGNKIHYYKATQAYTIPFALTESPVLAMPIGLNSRHLPIGIQVVGKRYEDFRLLQIGKALNKYIDRIEYPLNRN